MYFKDCEHTILDEPSDALDPISEDRIFEQLYQLSEGKSSVTVSHRLSNTTLVDKILVIDDGHIIEQGSHFELLKQNGKYTSLFKLQAEKIPINIFKVNLIKIKTGEKHRFSM